MSVERPFPQEPQFIPVAGKNFLFHVGAPKAGSSTFQHYVFPAVHSDQIYYHRGMSRRIARCILRQARTPSPFRDIGKLRQEVAEILDGVKQGAVLCSDEHLLGSSEHAFFDWPAVVDVMSVTFPGCKVILFTRRQDTWAESLYLQKLQELWSLSKCDYFVMPGDSAIDIFAYWWPRLDVRTLDFLGLYQTLVARIPKEDVLVIPFEQVFAADSDIKPLTDFLGHSPGALPRPGEGRVNQSYNALSATVARRINWLFRYPFRKGGIIPLRPFQKRIERSTLPEPLRSSLANFAGCLSLRYVLREFINPLDKRRANVLSTDEKATIMRFHAGRNRVLAEETGVDLRRYGYY